ncbi:MAG: NAD(P)-dependent alcohol dehydrogenase [Polyangiaceae bacterium]
MKTVRAYAAVAPNKPLGPFEITRRDPRPHDVSIHILWSGVCHSDIHQARDEWGGSRFPMVPGHEIVGRVTAVGGHVRRFKVGDIVGVGCMVDSCRICDSCQAGLEQYCDDGPVWTYNSVERDGETPTQGGYSTDIVCNESFVLKVPSNLDLAASAPLLCAGITTYSPLKHWGVEPGKRVAVLGLGGLGHMAVKLAAAMGAEVTVLSSSPSKRADALRLGAGELVVSSDDVTMAKHERRYDLVLDTVSANHDLAPHLKLLKRDGTMVLVGVPEKPLALSAFGVIAKRRSIAGSLIGGIAETQQMLDFCGEHGIGADVEVIPMADIERAYERMLKSDVRYRFVIDAATLG